MHSLENCHNGSWSYIFVTTKYWYQFFVQTFGFRSTPFIFRWNQHTKMRCIYWTFLLHLYIILHARIFNGCSGYRKWLTININYCIVFQRKYLSCIIAIFYCTKDIAPWWKPSSLTASIFLCTGYVIKR